MFTLVADVMSEAWSGEVARETFATIEDAETKMARWARFGVDDYSTDADLLRIMDESGTEIRRWHWRQGKPIHVEPAPPSP